MQTSSPTPSTQLEVNKEDQEGLNFIDALKLIQMGRKVHKLDWEDKEFYLQINGGILRLHKPDKKYYDFIISESDMAGQDYIELFN